MTRPASRSEIDELGFIVRLLDCPVAEQAITPARNGLQQSPIRAKGLAGHGYMKLKRIFLDDRARPHATHQIVLVDEFTARLNQNLDDLECAASEGNKGSAPPQFMPSEINLPPIGRVHGPRALFQGSTDFQRQKRS